ncbi:MAG: response regulator [Aquabacterium sp.]|uniref:ATP-binding protein n=1 Tax=Aquabacterium sp. TaxID=1872578 RepID=UPI0025BDA89F|nr:ATP-binding protein [Aquabacterium sp.]MBI3383706.1 response regulator [Aquabacterium sp.]
MSADQAHAKTLSEQVRITRTRLLFSHIPLGTSIAVGLGCLITLLVAYLVDGVISQQAWIWLGGLVVLSSSHIYRSLRYFRSRDRSNPIWLKRVKLFILVLSTWWGGLLWTMPIQGHVDVQATLVGVLIGLAACGAFMLTVDRNSARCWLVPMLTSVALYCAVQASVLGLFGFITVTGFIGILWLETGRAHRRMDELLFLRFTNDRVTSSQAAALREAEELNQAKGQFLATMSHEMRTPLHGILGLSRLIRAELQSQQAHERMNLLEASGQHLLGVINDVLDYSRLQAGRMELSPAAVRLSDLVREVTALAAVNGLDKGLDVTMACDLPEHYFVEVDGGRLKQILYNLLGNAVKFTERGQVTMRVREIADAQTGKPQVCLEVEDTGIGIPPHELNRVFDAFHQVDGRYERKTAGSGLGLSIARELCLAMGGDLACDSEAGKGSVFRCVLPLKRVSAPAVAQAAPATVDARQASSAAPRHVQPVEAARASDPVHKDVSMDMHPDIHKDASSQAATVLLVEDNPVNAIVARTELEQMGLQVAHAENGQLALDWLAEHEADLVLMDCHMPEMNGFDATRHIRAIESQRGDVPVPIVALTASTHQEVQQACLQAGMNDCLSKPFLRGELLRIVKRHVSDRSRRARRSKLGTGLVIAT